MKSFKQFFKRWHIHWFVLRFVLIAPLFAIGRVGEWATEAAKWLCKQLPDPNKEQ
jgi:hypothetical protein